MKDQKWRYVMSVRTDVGYRHPDHEFHNYQEMLSAGGECGPRAFFGRFISKAWGIPTWGVRQPGHAAMTHWTNDRSIGGWTVCLGAGWEYSWWKDDRYGSDTRRGPDFLEETQARTSSKCPDIYYKEVVLLECLAESLGETVEEDFVSAKVWRSLALSQRKLMARVFLPPSSKNRSANDNNDDGNTFSRGTGDGVCNEFGCICHASTSLLKTPFSNRPRSSVQIKDPKTLAKIKASFMRRQKMAKELNKVKERLNKPDGTIVIPATSFVYPTKPSKNVLVMKSFLGGDQLHLEQDGQVEYEMPLSIIAAGTYAMTATVVNVHRDQKPLIVCIVQSPDGEETSAQNPNDSHNDGYEMIYLPQGQEMEVQYTKGSWEQTKSIKVDLSPGGRLKLSRKKPCWGLSIKEIFLKPV